MYIFSIVCGILVGFSKISLIDWSEPELYIQFSSSAIIVSQAVDSNLVFNHSYGYLSITFVLQVLDTKSRILPLLDWGGR